MAKKMYSIALVNMRDGSVQGHRGDCADLKRMKNKVDEPWVFDVETKHEAWFNYNADFIAETPEGEDVNNYAWPIDWLPCANHVPAGGEEPQTNPEDAAMDRLRYLVAQAHADTFETRGGVVRQKTAKRKEREQAVAEEVVRFAFDHAGITGGELAPGGLYLKLMKEAGKLNR